MGARSSGRGGGRGAIAAALLVAGALIVPAPAAAARAPRCKGSHWVTTLATAPAFSIGGFNRETIRLTVTPHMGGRRFRVRLSNRWGLVPVTFSSVRLARRAGGAALVPGTSRRVTFGGSSSVTIPRGAAAVSDPIPLRVRAFQGLALSMYAPGPTGPATTNVTNGTEVGSRVAPGDQTANASGASFSRASTALQFLEGIDVLAPRRAGAVVAFGDSITHGFNSTFAQRRGQRDTRWPDFLARRLIRARRPLSVPNVGNGGNKILLDGAVAGAAVFGPSALSRLADDVLSVPGATDVIVLLGINDIGGIGPSASPEQVIAGLRLIVSRLNVQGLRVTLGTLTPAGGETLINRAGTPDGNRTRVMVNRWIRRTKLPHTVVDFEAALRDPRRPDRMLRQLDSGDHIHPNARGYERMAARIKLTRLKGTGCR